MQPVEKKRQHRFKKRIEEFYPKKKWLSLDEAAAFIDVSVNLLQNLVSEYGLSVHTLPPVKGQERSYKKYYRPDELEALIEDNVLIRKVS